MPKTTTTSELRKMSSADLRKEIADKRAEVAKMAMAVRVGSQKDTAKFRTEKKQIARMLTILSEVEQSARPALKHSRKASKVSAPTSAKATAGTSAS